jgi:hypothetical protein
VSSIGPLRLLRALERTLADVGLDVPRIINEFGQVHASEDRARGKTFTLRDHVRGLVLSLLSNQRPWGPIAQNLTSIDRVFLGYDPELLQAADPSVLVEEMKALRCGNRAIAEQMRTLGENIDTLRRVEADHGSLDRFVESEPPDRIARRLAGRSPYKLKQIGFTLAMEYLRNVGVRACKPDVHVRRILSNQRLGYSSSHPSEEEAYEIVDTLADRADCNPTYLDNLLWLFCARDYGCVCGAKPRCGICGLREECNYPPDG